MTTESGTRTGTVAFVSIIIPVYNEEQFIDKIMADALEQDYPSDRFEVIVVDGMSKDRTAQRVRCIQKVHPNVRLIENPRRIVSTGLNRGIASARGEIIVRLDGHCEYPRDYVRTLVDLRQKLNADDVGGVLVPLGEGYVQRSVAAAYASPVGVGSRALKALPDSHEVTEVDTVHAGCWKRERLLQAGGFDETMVRNQDDELSFRLRKNSGRIFQTTEVRIKYHVRNSFIKLFQQFAQYGYWKVQVVRKHPQQASLRHVVPALFILLVLSSMALAPFSKVGLWAPVVLLGGYCVTVALVSAMQMWREPVLVPGVAWAVAMMHFGYGSGFIVGCLRQLLGPLPTDRIFEQVTR